MEGVTDMSAFLLPKENPARGCYARELPIIPKKREDEPAVAVLYKHDKMKVFICAVSDLEPDSEELPDEAADELFACR